MALNFYAPEFLAVRDYVNTEVAKAKDRLTGDLDPIATAVERGRIRALKSVLKDLGYTDLVTMGQDAAAAQPPRPSLYGAT